MDAADEEQRPRLVHEKAQHGRWALDDKGGPPTEKIVKINALCRLGL